ncbi:TonB-dependent receptor [Stutzerimonas kirkiae]|nr:TonB-dependent receptor [Stutzerimonas kirkiae]TBV14316.1 TonB-dependent receptor [Stutzerimonas kirkiae]
MRLNGGFSRAGRSFVRCPSMQAAGSTFPKTRLAVALLGIMAGTGVASADELGDKLSTVVVTGTRADNRTVADSMQPIQVVSAKTLQDSGSSELSEALSRLIPSLNFPRPASSGFTGVIRPAQMRGLAPDQVLVLVNGKRRHTGAFLNTNVTQGRGSAPVDLSAIPLSAIDRVEVLGDGASARYGSDAIAGVINVILKADPDGGQVTTSYGQYAKGDGIQRHVDGNTGLALGERGSLHLSFDGSSNDYTSRAGRDLRNPGAPGYGQTTYRLGDPELKTGKLMVNGDYALNDDITLYGFAGYNRTEGDTWDAFRNGRASVYDAQAYPDGYRPTLSAESEDRSIVLGLRGLLGGWKWDASANYGENEVEFNTRDSLNRYLFRDTGSRQQDFYVGRLESTQAVYQLDLSNELAVAWLPNPLSVAFGAEGQHQTYRESAGEPASYYGTGAEGYSGFRDSDSGSYRRDLLASYIDLETDLTDKWRASLALRHDRYSDFGGATTGSLSSRYDFTPAFAVRGSVSSGYRAPSLAQQHYSATTSALNTAINAYQDQRTAPVDDPVARLLGAEDLKAEKSRNISAGIVWQPSEAFTTTFDIYHISIDDRITLSSNLNVQSAAAQAYLAANGITPGQYQSVRYFTNAVDTTTQGAELTAQHYWRFDHGGRLTSALGYAYNRTRVTDVKANPAVLSQNGLNLQRIDRRDRYGVLTDSAPRSKLSLSNDYTIGNWGFHSNLVRYGSFLAVSNSGAAYDQRYQAKWVLDLSTSYSLDNWQFTVGGDNVTDAYPDKRNSLNNPGHQNVNYISYSPFGINGAFYYAKVSYQW